MKFARISYTDYNNLLTSNNSLGVQLKDANNAPIAGPVPSFADAKVVGQPMTPQPGMPAMPAFLGVFGNVSVGFNVGLGPDNSLYFSVIPQTGTPTSIGPDKAVLVSME